MWSTNSVFMSGFLFGFGHRECCQFKLQNRAKKCSFLFWLWKINCKLVSVFFFSFFLCVPLVDEHPQSGSAKYRKLQFVAEKRIGFDELLELCHHYCSWVPCVSVPRKLFVLSAFNNKINQLNTQSRTGSTWKIQDENNKPRKIWWIYTIDYAAKGKVTKS